MRAALGDNNVLNVFPQRFVLLEVNHGGRLAAFLVSDELNASHVSTSQTRKTYLPIACVARPPSPYFTTQKDEAIAVYVESNCGSGS